MISSWRRRRAAHRAGKKLEGGLNLIIPANFRCPISLDLMKDPVTLSTGITYDRESIETWIESGNNTCPITKQVLTNLDPIPNQAIRKMIQDWCVQNRTRGVDRIPTPRTPLTSLEASEIVSKVMAVGEGCLETVEKIKDLVKESDRNRRRMVAQGGGIALSTAFEAFSETKASFRQNCAVMRELLSALTLMFPLDEKAKSHLCSSPSLNCIVWLLKNGDLLGKKNASLVLKEIVSTDEEKANALVETQGAIGALVNLIKESSCPTTTKASLMTIYYMVSSSISNQKVIARFVEVGIVPLLLEMLVDSDRSVCERALGVLDGICSYDEGREKAYGSALTVPVLVKKLLRVSDLATEFSVSILWKLSKSEKREDGGVIVEALQVGAFQKLLLMLQVGCGESTKEKVSELLKMLNLHRDRLGDCVDSGDFKDLKRPF
ncbi:U-box domain-containing protein [Actinidia chinensis var. chinensis]|uniref:U-box domain-containing protein n=1 Tax=Actinidia chinensis var. chinensis TaxID=1590841 RepID=A0A2R6P3N3_ACTCC|nr:U-box domain-containing protein [Actinidia chinensis var. chinensis]